MARFQRFEEIKAWQKARELTREVYEVSGQSSFKRDYGLRDQIRRASISVMSNIAEGFERNGNGEFIQFLSVAKGSVGEVRSQLYIARDEEYITQQQLEELGALAQEVSRLISGLLRHLQRSDFLGPKYQQRS